MKPLQHMTHIIIESQHLIISLKYWCLLCRVQQHWDNSKYKLSMTVVFRYHLLAESTKSTLRLFCSPHPKCLWHRPSISCHWPQLNENFRGAQSHKPACNFMWIKVANWETLLAKSTWKASQVTSSMQVKVKYYPYGRQVKYKSTTCVKQDRQVQF